MKNGLVVITIWLIAAWYISGQVTSVPNASTGTGGGMADPGGNGIMSRTALNTSVNRTITGTAGEINVSNGDGVSGNPTLSFANALVKSPGSNGLVACTGTNCSTSTIRTITAGGGISVSNGDGSSGNPTITALMNKIAEFNASNVSVAPGTFDLLAAGSVEANKIYYLMYYRQCTTVAGGTCSSTGTVNYTAAGSGQAPGLGTVNLNSLTIPNSGFQQIGEPDTGTAITVTLAAAGGAGCTGNERYRYRLVLYKVN